MQNIRLSKRGVVVLGVVVFACLSVPAHGDGCTNWARLTPEGRRHHATAYDSKRGVTVLFGGDQHDVPLVGDTWEWDGQTWTRRSTTGPPPRVWHAMAYDSVREVTVLFGGTLFDGSHGVDTWEWDGETWTQRDVVAPGWRTDHVMTYDSARGVTVLVGGAHAGPFGVIAETWEYDGVSWKVHSLLAADAPGAWLLFSAMAYDSARGVSVLFGGGIGSNVHVGNTWEWDGMAWSLRSTGGPAPRAFHSMAYDSARGVTVLFGGEPSVSGGATFFSDTWEWNGDTWAEIPASGPAPREALSLSYDSLRAVTVLFGGKPWGPPFDDTWEWDGVSWVQRDPLGPNANAGHAMVYDTLRDRTVLFGGATKQETWEHDGASWILKNPTRSPSARREHAVAYDALRGVTVLFGGRAESNSQYLGDTWEWNGTDWAQVSTTGPSPRREHATAFDSTRGVTVLFGGQDELGNPLDDTWEWNGIAWSLRSLNGPSVRKAHALVFDSARGVTVMFGGNDGAELDDTWEWNGETWTLVSVTGPPARSDHAMTFDELRGLTTLYGGWNGEASSDVWEWDGALWRMRAVTDVPPVSDHAMVYDSMRNVTVTVGSDGIPQEYTFDVVAAQLPTNLTVVAKSRYLSLETGDAGSWIAIQVTPVALPPAFAAYEGIPLWVSGSKTSCENAGEAQVPCSPAPGFDSPTTQTATLSCSPDFRVWNNAGTINISHELIVPGGTFAVQTIHQSCDLDVEQAYSTPLPLTTSAWADVGGPYDVVARLWTIPDGSVDVAFDVVAILDKFMNRAAAPEKTRVDLQPSTPDQIIDVLDISFAIDAFRGMKYPFLPTNPPCGR